MDLIKRINKQSAILLIPVALLSAFIEWKKLPLSILLGGIVGLANFKGLHWGVTGLMNLEAAGGARGKLVLFSLFRLLFIFLILGILVYLKLVNIFGVLTGLTVVFLLVMKEGFMEARKL
jgi:hypothetical protein